MFLTLHGSPVVLALVVVVAAAIAVFYYRRTVPPVTGAAKYTMIALRALGLALLLLVLFEPLLHRVFTEVREPRVVVLVDNSQSVGITDASGDRREAIKSVVGAVLEHPRRAMMDGMLFGDSVSEGPLDSLRRFNAGGASTNIAAALRAAANDRDARNTQAIVLVSDGVFTSGNDPRGYTSSLPFPIYTIGIGDSSEPRDIAVTSVIANTTVLLGNSMPVDVQVHSTGFDGQSVGVTLFDENTVVATQRIDLRAAQRDYTLSFTATPTSAGQHKFRVAVAPQAGEQTERNNARTFFVRVIDSKITVALVAGAPGPDVSFVAQALAANPHITVLKFIQNSTGGFLPTPQQGAMGDATCFVMVDFPTRATTQQTIASVIDVLQRKTAPLLFVWGHDVDAQLAQRFDAWLPFVFTPTRSTEQLVGISVPPDALADPVMRVQGDVRDSAAWHALPPSMYVESGFRAKPGSTVLATMRVFGTTSHQPVILSQHLNRSRALAVLSSGTWRWRLLGKGLADATGSQQPDVYTAFFTNVVQWLTAAESDKPVRIQPVKQVFTPGEEIQLAGEVMDAKFAPVDDATVEATVSGAAGTFAITLAPKGNGRYQGSLSRLPEGDYTLTGAARVRENPLGTDAGKFTVADLGAEFQDVKMNATLLRSIATHTGGVFASSGDARRLLDSLFANPRVAAATTVHSSEVELWTNVWMLAASLAAFCVEWFLRKRKGLL